MTGRNRIGRWLGPLFAILVWGLGELTGGLAGAPLAVASVAVLMTVWWITEAIPIPATALLPLALFPLLQIMPAAEVSAAYANHLIFLFLGGFLIALAVERWQLHRRIALHTIALFGTTPSRIVLGFMVATASLSMWISNTATVMMMLPIGLAVIRQLAPTAGDEQAPKVSSFATALMLGIAYAGSIGGVATLIGTPPNAILAGIVEQNYGRPIGFAQWLAFGLPLAVIMLGLTWVYLTRVAFSVPGSAGEARSAVRAHLRELGPMSPAERRVLAVFVLVAAAWVARGFIPWEGLGLVRDSTIAILGGIALFLVPAGGGGRARLLDWDTAVRLPWDIILLFGGGFALAKGFQVSGLTQWIGAQLSLLGGVPLWALVLAVAAVVIFLTEVTSNTATASLMLPVVGALAAAIDVDPLGLMAAAAVSASFAFMLPVATPPNAIVYGSRQVPILAMVRAGFWLNLIGCVLLTLLVMSPLPRALGLSLN